MEEAKWPQSWVTLSAVVALLKLLIALITVALRFASVDEWS